MAAGRRHPSALPERSIEILIYGRLVEHENDKGFYSTAWLLMDDVLAEIGKDIVVISSRRRSRRTAKASDARSMQPWRLPRLHYAGARGVVARDGVGGATVAAERPKCMERMACDLSKCGKPVITRFNRDYGNRL